MGTTPDSLSARGSVPAVGEPGDQIAARTTARACGARLTSARGHAGHLERERGAGRRSGGVGSGRLDTGRVVVALAAALVAGGLASCGDSGGVRSSTRAGADGREIPGVGLSGAGSPLMEGLVVPPGTQLIGPVFPRPRPLGAEERSSVAVLTVEEDPFAAWDDLAGQAHALGTPLPSSGVCAWHDVTTEQGGLLQPVLVEEPRPDGADALVCTATAHGPSPGGGLISITARLWWDAEGAELGLEVSAGDVLGVGDDAVAAGDDDQIQAFPDDPGPAPPSAVGQLPPVEDAPDASAGDPFGQETNCFEDGYARLRIPDGARLVGGGTAPVVGSFAAVLAVADARAALEDIAAQLDPTGPDAGDGSVTIEQVGLSGDRIWLLTGDVGAGGGSCEMWSSPDGQAVLVTTWND